MRSAARIDPKATLRVEAGVVVRMVMELEERRREDAEKPDGPFRLATPASASAPDGRSRILEHLVELEVAVADV
jgi:hypothetical protein